MSRFDELLQRWDYKHPRLMHAALEYAALGLRVIPLHGKNPILERWPERATSDPSRIVKWFETWHDENLGIVTGDGLLVVDVDPRNGGRRSIRKLTQGREWPMTATALTGSGGHHYLFRVDPALRIASVNGLLPGIDIKGAGGQIAVEPSIHPSTNKEYVWLRTPKQVIADAPSWLVKMLMERGHPQPAVSRSCSPLALTRDGDVDRELAVALARFPVTGYGQRNNQMVRVVSRLVGKGYNTDMIQAVVTVWWQYYYEQGVIRTPPYEAPREVAACIASILRSTTFRRAVGTDHRSEIGRIELSHDQKALLYGVITPTGIARPTPHSNRVTYAPKLCAKRHERPFVEALTVYFTYKVTVLQESPLKATNDQFRWVMEDRHGLKLDNTQFNRLVKRYISRPSKPASHYELTIQTLKGKNNVPSEYELTGLRQLMPPEAPGSPLMRPKGSPALPFG